jgi:hypothetical protein
MTAHKNIYVALAAAQLEMGNVTKGSVNSHFRSRYADLADVTAAVIPVLASHGISTHYVVEDNCVVTVLTHGETETSLRCAIPLIVSKNDVQGLGSALTYCRRYGLMAISGVAAEDDDGNAAAAAAPRQAAGPSDAAIEKAITNLTDAENIDALVAVWNSLHTNQPLLARNKKVVAAKDARKAMLSGGFGEEVAAQ